LKTGLSILLFFFFVGVNGQQLTDFDAPKGAEKIIETRGDLDKDGIEEAVFAYQAKDSAQSRTLYICKITAGKYRLWKKNTSVLWPGSEFGAGDNEIDISIKSNVLCISQTFYSNSRSSMDYKSKFRFQDGDWYLIGSTCNAVMNCYFDDTCDINFMTGKVQITKTSIPCDDQESKDKDEKFSFMFTFEKIKMDHFVAGQHEIQIPNRGQYFSY
jgi:hypothetical protein